MKLVVVGLFGALVLTGITGGAASESAVTAAQFLLDTINNNGLVLFTKAGCPHCEATKEVFRRLHYPALDVDLDSRPDAGDLQTALWRLTGYRTVPQVFVRGRFVGGAAAVLAWYRNSTTGHLFSRRKAETTTEAPVEDARQLAFTKLLRTSENAIQWIGNKTSKSLNGLFTSKNHSSHVLNGQAPVTEGANKNKLLAWLRRAVKNKFHYKSEAPPSSDSPESQSPEDSGESLVIAHRTKDNRFAWGPPSKNATGVAAEAPDSNGGLFRAAGLRVQSVLTFIYQETKTLTNRGKNIIRDGLTKVFAKKDPYLMRNHALDSIEQQLENMERNNATHGVADVGFVCDDTMRPVCAVDLDKHYTIFQNECKMVLYNYKHGTNFSVYDNDVCIGLFVRRPELFYQSPENEQAQKKP